MTPVVGALVLLYGVAGWLLFRRRAARRAREALSDASGEMVAALAEDLRAGAPPANALRLAAAGLDPVLRRYAGDRAADRLGQVTVAATTGGDVPRALRGVRLPGRSAAARLVDRGVMPSLGRLAAAWSVAEQVGGPMAPVLLRVADDLRAARRVRRSVASHLAGVRVTAMLLSGLPVLAVPFGATLGVDPLDTLLGTPLGGGCAVASAVLQLAGLGWTGRVADTAARSS